MSRGTEAASSFALPISTETELTCPSRQKSFRRRMPPAVSTERFSVRRYPLSYMYLPTQRRLLPAIFPSLPSRLKLRMRTSALAECSMSTIPSAPMP